MEWTECTGRALEYIEAHLTEPLTIEAIAREALVSPFYFQKGFALLCGFTVGEYIRRRRLTLAGSELVFTDHKIIDLALKYGYDSPDSFTKAFTRFHGATPTCVRRGEAMIRSFAPLKIKLTLNGGYTMDYKITQKDQFTLVGVCKTLTYEEAAAKSPQLWAEFYQLAKGKELCSMYGVSIDEQMGGDTFEYMVADDYAPAKPIPQGFVTRVIPAHTWAVFACSGPAASSLPAVHRQIFSEWLPACEEYEIAAGCHIEWYADPAQYPNGAEDPAYRCEIWIPVHRK